MPRKYITITQAAKISGKSQAYIKTLAGNGKVESHIGKGNVVKIHFDSLESYMNRHFSDEEKKLLKENRKTKSHSKKTVNIPSELSTEYENALKDFQDEIGFYVSCKEGFKDIGGTAKDTIYRLIELTVDHPRAAAMMRDFIDNGMRISSMKDFGVTNERKRQIIVKGFNRMFRKLEEYDKLLSKANEQEKKIELLTARYNFAMSQLRMAESQGFTIDDKLRNSFHHEDQDKELLTPLQNTSLSVRAKNCLKDVGVSYLEDLQAYTPAKLKAIRNFGRKSLREVIYAMKEHGLALAPDKE